MTANSNQKVFVMMSGGVDSSVAALLLKEQGFKVEGVFMKNWSPNSLQSLTDCPWEQDQADAEAVAKQLNIPFRSVNFEKEYKTEVVDYFLQGYRAGRTPNPDVMCNKAIKFGAFFEWAMAEGADLVATGHYARTVDYKGQKLVARGVDESKDQSYFLWALKPEIIQKTLFPVGELTKKEVRRRAQEAGLVVANKKDSQGICFIGHLNVGQFLRDELGVKPGKLVLADGTVVGEHDGAYLLTIGQRHGFNITEAKIVADALKIKRGSLPALYVINKDIESNTVTIGPNKAQSRQTNRFKVEQFDWHIQPVGNKIEALVQVRYRQKPVEADIILKQSEVITKKPVTAVAPGQFAVIYDQAVVLGGGIIVL